MNARATIELEITASSPLMLTGRKASGVPSESLKFIPGRILRGALADAILRLKPHVHDVCTESCDFCTLFSSTDRAIFRNAYPSQDTTLSKPAASTIMGCKIYEAHGAFDTLSGMMLSHILGVKPDFHCRHRDNGSGQLCDERLERKSGFILRKATEHVHFAPKAADRELVRVGIDRARRGAADEVLYNLVVLSEICEHQEGDDVSRPTTFRSRLECSAELVPELQQIIECRLKHIGGAVSRGLGAVEVKVERKQPAPLDTQERIVNWNKALAAFIESNKRPKLLQLQSPWKEIVESPGFIDKLRSGESGFIVIDLLSDALLPDYLETPNGFIHSGSYGFVLQDRSIRYQTGCNAQLQLLMSQATPSTRGGWNLAWGLPRDVNVISKSGGVFVYWAPDLKSWYAPLSKLELSGVGCDVDQGFGEIEICAVEHVIDG